MIGLTGAHRTGKTTLARAFSKSYSVPLLETSTSAVFKELGFDPKADYDFKVRLFIQNRILDVAESLYRSEGGVFITDRTPLDMLAYTMADVQRANLDRDDVTMFMDYMNRCIDVTNHHFASLMIVQPGIALVEEDGKAPANPAYIEHINSLIMGLMADGRIKSRKHFIGRRVIGLEERVNCVKQAVESNLNKHLQATATLVFH
jgi:predicted ATPase